MKGRDVARRVSTMPLSLLGVQATVKAKTNNNMQGIGFMPANVKKIRNKNNTKLKLEINKRLQVGRDELVNHEDNEGAHQDHHRDGHLGEPYTVTTLDFFW